MLVEFMPLSQTGTLWDSFNTFEHVAVNQQLFVHTAAQLVLSQRFISATSFDI